MKMYFKALWVFGVLFCLLLGGCTPQNSENAPANSPEISDEQEQETMSYECISQSEAKALMDGGTPPVILDVREQSEFNEGHIPGALLIPYTQIEQQAEEKLPDKDALILVYCRSGRRSKIAAQSLADLGYTNVKEFGGIIDWQYEIVK